MDVIAKLFADGLQFCKMQQKLDRVLRACTIIFWIELLRANILNKHFNSIIVIYKAA